MKIKFIISVFVLLFLFCSTFKTNATPKVYYLINQKQLIENRDKLLADKKALNELIQHADKLLNNKIFSVTFKTSEPPSGNKHDYITIAPYFWPDSTKVDGKPYIRRDGEVNPESRNNVTDFVEFEKFVDAVNALTKAAFSSNEKKYSIKAIQLLDAWFVNKETKMNPNLNFGQAVPGESLGRPFGVIEMMGLEDIMKAIETLESNNQLNAKTRMKYDNWFKAYALWLTTSELGLLESKSKNNHGTTYDVQLCSIYFFLNKLSDAKTLIESVKTNRIDTQIAADGSQPHELERTKSISYSTMNLSAFTTLARYGNSVNVDLWNYTSSNGSSIKKAYQFLSNALDKNYNWKYKQIADPKGTKVKLAKLFIQTGESFNDTTLTSIGKDYLNY